jgi:hypothetical protein
LLTPRDIGNFDYLSLKSETVPLININSGCRQLNEPVADTFKHIERFAFLAENQATSGGGLAVSH